MEAIRRKDNLKCKLKEREREQGNKGTGEQGILSFYPIILLSYYPIILLPYYPTVIIAYSHTHITRLTD
jgi:hypothetical protein